MVNKRDIVTSAVKMVNAGRKMGKDRGRVLGDSSSNKICYPTLYLEGEEAKLFNGIDVGSTTKVLIEGEIKSKILRENGTKKTTEVSIDVKKVGIAK